MIVLDTDVLIDVLRKHPSAVDWARGITGEELVIPGIVAMELVVGSRNRADLNTLQRALRSFRVFWPSPTACEAALATQSVGSLSHGINVNDCLIAHSAMEPDVPLHTFNVKHFGAVVGLQTVQPYIR